MKFKYIILFFVAFTFIITNFWPQVDARGRRGGRGFSRAGIASRGSFSARRSHRSVSRQPQRRYQQRARITNQVQSKGQNRIRSGKVTQQPNMPKKRQLTTEQRKQIAQRREAMGQRTRDTKENWQDRQEKRQEFIKERQEDRQEFIKDRQEDRQDFIEDIHDDHWDDHWDSGGEFVAGVIVGGAIGAAAASSANQDTYVEHHTTYVTTLPCQPREININGITYLNCANQWYQRSFAGSEVIYVVVAPPPGY